MLFFLLCVFVYEWMGLVFGVYLFTCLFQITYWVWYLMIFNPFFRVLILSNSSCLHNWMDSWCYKYSIQLLRLSIKISSSFFDVFNRGIQPFLMPSVSSLKSFEFIQISGILTWSLFFQKAEPRFKLSTSWSMLPINLRTLDHWTTGIPTKNWGLWFYVVIILTA